MHSRRHRHRTLRSFSSAFAAAPRLLRAPATGVLILGLNFDVILEVANELAGVGADNIKEEQRSCPFARRLRLVG
ncbi:hypothetical protein J2Y41_004267 [Arthrobacter sp. 1088]|uniref:hypothetical protein n=1 Tax=Arthrobacter sp. 1088 TaxID=2817768 RepID=UPI00285B785B|nr:hypothetical protein [Arthrobacter sp. 1088]MDR6688672.1 hypothetical protein [Arthrobacter sp. 1088]